MDSDWSNYLSTIAALFNIRSGSRINQQHTSFTSISLSVVHLWTLHFILAWSWQVVVWPEQWVTLWYGMGVSERKTHFYKDHWFGSVWPGLVGRGRWNYRYGNEGFVFMKYFFSIFGSKSMRERSILRVVWSCLPRFPLTLSRFHFLHLEHFLIHAVFST